MRIAYVTETYPPEINGVALTVERAVRHLREQGHELDLIRPRQRGEGPRNDPDEWRTAGAPIPMYPDLRMGWATPWALKRRFERKRPQILHISTEGPLGWAALRAARQAGVPVTTDFRTNFHWYSRYYGFGWMEPVVCAYLRHFHNMADATFVPTRELPLTLGAMGFERVEQIGRGIDSAHFSPARRSEALRAQWGVERPDDVVMAYVGRLAPEKNVELALLGFMQARARHPRLRMVVVGDGPMRQALQQRFPEALFVGAQRGETLAAMYASADVFLFPSRSETFGNVTLEALASGLAVVAFDVAAAAEHIVDGQSGLLVAEEDDAGFIAAVERAAALGMPGLAPLRANAREHALATDWSAVLHRFELRLAHYAAAPRGADALPPRRQPDFVEPEPPLR